MIIHDDADTATVVRETVAAIREGARHIGKADRELTGEQIREVGAAITELQAMLALKVRTNAHRT